MARRKSRLRLTRNQILTFRRMAQGLTARWPQTPVALSQAAWAGLQDSMPRAAVLSLHARVDGTTPTAWETPPLTQVWGPRYSAFVVHEDDVSLFTLARLPDRGSTRRVAQDLADRLAQLLGDERMTQSDAARALGEPANRLRYATLTGRVRMRWDGARQPTIWMAAPPDTDVRSARLELARRHLHVFGPSTAEAFGAWAGITPDVAASTYTDLDPELLPVDTPVGHAWIIDSDEALARRAADDDAPARLLPSGDTYFLLQLPDQRALLIDDARCRACLWTSRVWPGAVLVNGAIVGTWRRADTAISIETWRRLSRPEREAVEAEASTLPLPGRAGVSVSWMG